jgi:hypothetical protein
MWQHLLIESGKTDAGLLFDTGNLSRSWLSSADPASASGARSLMDPH